MCRQEAPMARNRRGRLIGVAGMASLLLGPAAPGGKSRQFEPKEGPETLSIFNGGRRVLRLPTDAQSLQAVRGEVPHARWRECRAGLA